MLVRACCERQRSKLRWPLGVVIWHICPKKIMCRAGYDYIHNFRNFLTTTFNSRCLTAIAQLGWILAKYQDFFTDSRKCAKSDCFKLFCLNVSDITIILTNLFIFIIKNVENIFNQLFKMRLHGKWITQSWPTSPWLLFPYPYLGASSSPQQWSPTCPASGTHW